MGHGPLWLQGAGAQDPHGFVRCVIICRSASSSRAVLWLHSPAGEGPTLYPVACAPQAWAAGSVFLLLQACLGLSIHSAEERIRFTGPTLPEFLKEVRIENLRVGKATVDLLLQRHPQDVSIRVLRMDGQIIIEKLGAGQMPSRSINLQV
jgi:Glycogen debranching enzyme